MICRFSCSFDRSRTIIINVVVADVVIGAVVDVVVDVVVDISFDGRHGRHLDLIELLSDNGID